MELAVGYVHVECGIQNRQGRAGGFLGYRVELVDPLDLYRLAVH